MVLSNWHNYLSLFFWMTFPGFAVICSCINTTTIYIKDLSYFSKHFIFKYGCFSICFLRIPFFIFPVIPDSSYPRVIFSFDIFFCFNFSVGFFYCLFFSVELVRFYTKVSSFNKNQISLLELFSHKIIVAVPDLWMYLFWVLIFYIPPLTHQHLHTMPVVVRMLYFLS